MRSRESFNKAAQLYDEVRPSYPDELIDWIIDKTAIKQNDLLLEIAPGTGQCTKKFVNKGYKIHAVELGEELAKLLLKNLDNNLVSVDVSAFEDWKAIDNRLYKLVFCATAWHWIDPLVKYEKVFNLLEDNGYLAIIWNNASGSDNDTILSKAYDLLFSYHKEKVFSTKSKTDKQIKTQNKTTYEEFEKSNQFLVEDYYEVDWSLLQEKEKVIKGFYSQSSYLSLKESDKLELDKKLEKVFIKLDKHINTYFKSVVYLLKKNTINS